MNACSTSVTASQMEQTKNNEMPSRKVIRTLLVFILRFKQDKIKLVLETMKLSHGAKTLNEHRSIDERF